MAIAALMVLGLPLMILLMLDPVLAGGVQRHTDRPGPDERAGDPDQPAADLRRRRPAVPARQQRLGVPSGTEQRRIDVRHLAAARRAFGVQLGRGGGPDADRDRRRRDRQLGHDRGRDPGRPARRRAATERVQRDRRRLRRRGAAEEMGGARELAGGAGRVEQLPARDRPGHTARRAVHQHRARESRRDPGRLDVDVAGAGGRAGMRARQRPYDPGRCRSGPAQRVGGDPAGRAAGGAGDDRRRQPDHRLPVQLRWRALAGVDEGAARPERRPRSPGERRPGLRLLQCGQLRALGRRPRAEPARRTGRRPRGR